MSSVEIVEVINQLRGPGKAELRHTTFMEKVAGHPGINAQNFLHTYSDPLGRTQNCYYLPKREAELMVMSESLAVTPVTLNVGETNGVQTMSSLDMVAYINATREAGKAELQHGHFLAKVPNVLGYSSSLKFLSHVQIPGPKGAIRNSPIYNFPRREAILSFP
jgi:hypothetical protein